MTPAQEHVLYQSNRAAWAKHVAPRWAEILKSSNDEERARTWAMACPELKRAIRAIAEEGAQQPGLFDRQARAEAA